MSEKHDWRVAVGEWRQNWRIGLAAFLAIGLSFGAFNAISSLFVLPLQATFGWSRAEIALAQNAALLAALAAPFMGRAVDRFGVRRLMIGGMVITAGAYLGMAAMNGSLALYYFLCVIASVIGLTASGLTCSRVVSAAFIQSRGFSLAVARSGLALAGALLPAPLFFIITTWGWRAGYVTQAVLVLLIAIPAVYFWIDRRTVGRTPGSASAARLPDWRLLLRDRRIAFLCLAAGLGYAPANAIMSQLQPILVSKGIVAADAAALVGVAGISSLFGALVTGLLVDRIWAPAVAMFFACGSAAGVLILALSAGLAGPTATVSILLIGLGLGAEIDIVAFLVARYFGVQSFGSVYGLSIFAVAGFGAIGASLLGLAYDRTGSYNSALFGVAASFFIAGLIYLLMGRYPDHDEVRA